MVQKKRLRILEQFIQGHLDILVATDVVTIGLDIPSVIHVFNYNLIDYHQDYFILLIVLDVVIKVTLSYSYKQEYSLNLPAIEEQVQHQISVNKYNSEALLQDLPTLKPCYRPYTNGTRRNNSS